jgi:hypothetical protein
MAPASTGGWSFLRLLRLLAPLSLLMLAKCPLVPFDHHSAVFANRYGACSAPSLRALTHQLPSLRVDASALLVAGQSRCCGDEPSLQAPEQQVLSPEVLCVEGGRGHRGRYCRYPWCLESEGGAIGIGCWGFWFPKYLRCPPPLLRRSVLWWRALGVGSVVALNYPVVA